MTVRNAPDFILSFLPLFNITQYRDPYIQERLSVLVAPRMVRSTFLFARLRSAGGIYLSGGLKPATETSRILTYPPLIKAGASPLRSIHSHFDFVGLRHLRQLPYAIFMISSIPASSMDTSLRDFPADRSAMISAAVISDLSNL